MPNRPPAAAVPVVPRTGMRTGMRAGTGPRTRMRTGTRMRTRAGMSGVAGE